ncbi:hypothetical protein EGY31_13985 [Burkholderia multivorans]|uniref:hypothetical protein n=1 Tax=Burkholderia ubonensis TaxID=101571 RepID=UPI000F6CB835|nr:hypothetical protein [Burkholderia ubonensis]AYZ64483.1 hypothetical protein EGY31_13985 [Burkholderia multivorans]
MIERTCSPASGPVRRTARTLAILAACCLPGAALNAQPANDATGLRAIYRTLTPQLDHNAFHRRLYLGSREYPSTVTGEIYAVIDYPFETVRDALDAPSRALANWCDVMILHPNIKYCHASDSSGDNMLTVNVSKKEAAEALDATFRMQFRYDAAAASPGYFKINLSADKGPLNTRDYRVAVEAVSLGRDRTFLHLIYTYGYGMLGRLAIKGYLATFDRGRVGFTRVANPSSAEQAEYVDGMRGLVERNTMRYYLAIEAYLGAPAGQPDTRLEQRLSNWFSASEQYSLQLHEIDRRDYMQMKQDEYHRQQTK